MTTRTCSVALTAAFAPVVAGRLTRSTQLTGLPGAFTEKAKLPLLAAFAVCRVVHRLPTRRCSTTGPAAAGDTLPEMTTLAPMCTVEGVACADTRVLT